MKNLNKYYDNYINKRLFQKKMELETNNMLRIVYNKDIKQWENLDVGCNGGFFLNKFPDQFEKYGIDIIKNYRLWKENIYLEKPQLWIF